MNRIADLLIPKSESPDLRQARLRVFLLAGCLLCVGLSKGLSHELLPSNTVLFNAYLVVYTVFAFEMLWHFSAKPDLHVVRRVLAVFADQGVAFILLVTTGAGALALFWLPLLITQSVGVRFGTRWLVLSQVVGLASVSSAIAINATLLQTPNFALGLVLATVILPVSLLVLTLREDRVRAELEATRKAADEACAAAARANEAKRAFIASISNELRSPLMGIVDLNEMFAVRPRSAEDRELLRAQRDAALLTLSAVNDILDRSKIDAGEMRPERIEFDVDTTVIQIVNGLTHQARHKHIELQVLVDAGSPAHVIGSPAFLTRFVRNLVANAIAFTTQGGVMLRLVGSPRSEMGTPWLRIEVIDAGTDLGTTIVRQWVDLLGGVISVDSAVGAGGCFTVDVPVELQAGADIPAAIGEPHVGLVVVDSHVSRFEALASRLTTDSLSIVRADDAVAAWNAQRALARQGARYVVFATEPRDDFIVLSDALAKELGDPPAWVLFAAPEAVTRQRVGHNPRLVTVSLEADTATLRRALDAAVRMLRVASLETAGGPSIVEPVVSPPLAAALASVDGDELLDLEHLEAPHSLFTGLMAAKLLRTFAADSRANMTLLDEAVLEGDYAKLRRGIHNLKGFAGVFGAARLDRLLDIAPTTQEAFLEGGADWGRAMRRVVEDTNAALQGWWAERIALMPS